MHEDDREDAKFEGVCAIALPNMKRCKIEAKKASKKLCIQHGFAMTRKKKPASSQLIGKRENGEKRTKRSATGASHAAFDGCTQIVVVRFAVHGAILGLLGKAAAAAAATGQVGRGTNRPPPSFRVAFGIVSSRPQRNQAVPVWMSGPTETVAERGRRRAV